MARRDRLAVILTLLASACNSRPGVGPVTANRTLINGDFAAPLSEGWTRQGTDAAGSHSIAPMKDGGVTVVKLYSGRAALVQRVIISELSGTFTARVRFAVRSNRAGYSSNSALVIAWLDAAGNELGQTVYGLSAPASAQPISDSRKHVVTAAKPGEWSDFSFAIADELSRNLTAVPKADVHSLSIALVATCAGGQPC